MTLSTILAVSSAILSAAGTYLMYHYSMTPGQFSTYWNNELIAEVKAQNAKRLRRQRIGLAILIAGIVLACVSVLV